MELQEAFETVFNDSLVKDAISSMEENHEKAEDILLEKLKGRMQFLATVAEDEWKQDSVLNKILWLLGRLEVKSAFSCLLELLQINQCCSTLDPQMLFICLLTLIPNEDGILLLRTGVLERTICQAARKTVCLAISESYRRTENIQEAEAFFSDLVSSFERGNLENFEDFDLLFAIFEPSMNLRSASLNEKMKELLIQLIIRSEHGFRSSRFEKYFHYLYQLDPLIASKIHDAKEYLRSLRYCGDGEMFRFEEIEDIGKYLCAKTSGAVKDIDLNIVKIAIKQLNYYSVNERPCPTTDKQYYREICEYLNLKKNPKSIYQQAKDLYQDVFVSRYSELKDNIKVLIRQTEDEQQKINEDTKQIIASANGNHSLFKTMNADMHRLAQNEIRIKELNSLYKKGEQGSTGVLVYTLKQLEHFLNSFCEEISDQEKTDDKLREISIRCAFSNTMKIEDYFLPYQRVLMQINSLLCEGPRTTLQYMFYHVKFIPFAEKIQYEYRNQIMAAKEDEQDSIVCEMRHKEETHPMHPVNLMNCAQKSLADYVGVLEQHLAQSTESIRAALNHSACLKKRRAVIEHCLDIIEHKEDELAINLLPVQMEGLFADLLEYTTIYKYIENIKLYNSLFKLELAEKIERSGDCDINIPFEMTAYFKYYFSSVIRNTVAHGNYLLLAESSEIHGEHWDINKNERTVRRVLALELLLDLNYLISVISEINEIDTAKRYIEYTAEQCARTEGEDRKIVYDCLFQDLNGTRRRLNVSKYIFGVFVTYDAQQILFWIFNPYYEQYLDADSLKAVRDTVCSAQFWEYVQEQLKKSQGGRWKKDKFNNIVQKMLESQEELATKGLMEQDTVKLMKEVCALLKKT